MSTSNTIRELSLRLENLEKIIDLMFELPGDTLVMLEKKVFQFENMTAEIPHFVNDMAKIAQAKVVTMWRRILDAKMVSQVTLVKEDSVSSGQSKNSISYYCNFSKREHKEKGSVFSDKVEPNTSSDSASGFSPTTPGPPVHSDTGDSTSRPAKKHPNGYFDLRKCELRYALESSFDLLSPIDSEANIDAIKNLLVEIAKARQALAFYYPQDIRLQFLVFTKAFSKLRLITLKLSR